MSDYEQALILRIVLFLMVVTTSLTAVHFLFNH